MSASLNRVILVGNLTKDPELKFITSGSAVANFRMAINRKWKDAQGQQKEEVCFVGVNGTGLSGGTRMERNTLKNGEARTDAGIGECALTVRRLWLLSCGQNLSLPARPGPPCV